MNSIIYLVGLVVVVLFILSVLVSMYGNLTRNQCRQLYVPLVVIILLYLVF